MALAFLQFRGRSEGSYVFQADIGTAKLFKYVLAEKRKKLRVGKDEFIEVLTENKKVSKVYQIKEAMHKLNNGSFPLKIPESEIEADTKYVQLYSFSNNSTSSPTISNIIRLYPVVGRRNEAKGLSYSSSFNNGNKNETTMQDTLVKNKEFIYREPRLSKIMFWNAIINALPTIVEHAAPILGSLLKNGKTMTSSNGGTTEENDKTTQVVNKIIEVLGAISNNANTAPLNGSPAAGNAEITTSEQPTNSQPVEPAQSYRSLSLRQLSSAYSLEPDTLMGLKPILEKILSPEAILAIGDEPQKLFKAIKDAVQKTETEDSIVDISSGKIALKEVQNKSAEKYSKAKIAPALLAALPALMPVIEKALDPKLIEAIGNQPMKLFKAIGDAVLKMDAQEIKHLEAVNPGVDSADDIVKLLQGMSISSSKYKEDIIKFKMIKNVNLNFVNTKTVQFKNKERVLYSKNQRIAIPFKIISNTGTPLNKVLIKSIIQIIIKDAESMDLVFRKNINLLNVDISNIINEAFLTPEEMQGIPFDTELKFELSYIWKSNKNENIGVFKSHYVHFMKSYIFDRIGERIGEPIPFNDINLHRSYWHKIWEGGFSKSNRWHVEFDLKYFYLLNLKENDISRLETKKQITGDNVESGEEHPKRRKVHAKLKSGTEFGVNALNNILTLANQQPLDESMLKVLGESDIEKSFQQVSRIRLEMKGREGDTSTLWAYPEISLYKLHVSRVENIDDYGQVTSVIPIEKVIPKPDFIHFIGTTSER